MSADVIPLSRRRKPAPPSERPDLATFHRRRGLHVVYRMDEVNHCPGCGRSHWWLGRLVAECGFCGTALPYVHTAAAMFAGVRDG